jgi:hypothetical protein
MSCSFELCDELGKTVTEFWVAAKLTLSEVEANCEVVFLGKFCLHHFIVAHLFSPAQVLIAES